MARLLAVCILYMLLPVCCLAQSEAAETALPSTDQKLENLERELGVIRDYNDDFLSTVHWSLGTVATVAAFLVGFGWFTNFRLIDREKDALRQEFESVIVARLREIEAKLNEDLAKGSSEAQRKASEAGKASASNLIGNLQGQINSLHQRVNDLRYDAVDAGLSEWMSQKIWGNAVSYGARLVSVARETGDQYRIGESLDKLLGALERLNKDDRPSKLETYDIQEVESTIMPLIDSYPTPVAAIRRQLARAKGME